MKARPVSRRTPRAASLLALAAALLLPPFVPLSQAVDAKAADEPKPAGLEAADDGSDRSQPDGMPAAPEDAPEDEIEAEPEHPSSEEQGRTSLDKSFRPQSRRQWIRDTRRKALRETKFDVQLRSFYFHRDKYDPSTSEALALGGSAGFKTGYFRERLAVGSTVYTSIKLYGPESKDGTLLLQPGQRDYVVVGQAFGDLRLFDGVHAVLGWQTLDTPFINRNDVRMTPNTFEAYIVQGVVGGENGAPEFRFGGGYVDEIKERNSDEFRSMAQDAGAPDGVTRGVFVLGGNMKWRDLSIGAIDYYSEDILNIAYTEAKYGITVADDWRLQFAAQYADERSTGEDLLFGHGFSVGQFGIKGEVGWRGALLTTAFTTTEDGDTNMQSPWGGYPGYTSVQVEDFNRGGEDAFLLRAAYKFSCLEGLSIYGLWVNGWEPSDPSQFAKDELDFNIQYALGKTLFDGWLDGLAVRFRYAHVMDDGPGDPTLDDIRLIVTYDPPSL